IGEIGKVVALPIIARAWCQQRIERHLPAGKWVRSDYVDNRLPKSTQGCCGLLAFIDVAAVAGGEDKNLPTVPFGWQERQRRRLAHYCPYCEFVRRFVSDAAILGQQFSRPFQRMHDEAGKHFGAKLVKPELEGGDDAKVAATAP